MSIRNNAYTMRQLTWAWRIQRFFNYIPDFIMGVCWFWSCVTSNLTRRYLGINYTGDTFWQTVKFQWKCRHGWDPD